ncbi:uncharacterized protein [Aristolochia californica]|uniref:uncharacterized protein isoform X2 n=1 Tax=Aristolochia californica TaxID=171875 RepID=UPI0035D54F34
MALSETTVPGLSFSRSLVNRQVPLPRMSFSPPVSLNSLRHSSCVSVIKRSPKRLKYSAPRFTKGGELLYVKIELLEGEAWKLEPVVELLKNGAVGVIPTDTVYAIVCDLKSHSAIERLRRIKDIDTSKYTFILPASKELPKQCMKYGAAPKSRKSVGVRMPDDPICQSILRQLDAPLISTSVKWPTQDAWMIDPVIIADTYAPEGLDFVVDGGIRIADPSTVVDMTGSSPTIIRQGKGPKQDWMAVKDEVDSTSITD